MTTPSGSLTTAVKKKNNNNTWNNTKNTGHLRLCQGQRTHFAQTNFLSLQVKSALIPFIYIFQPKSPVAPINLKSKWSLLCRKALIRTYVSVILKPTSICSAVLWRTFISTCSGQPSSSLTLTNRPCNRNCLIFGQLKMASKGVLEKNEKGLKTNLSQVPNIDGLFWLYYFSYLSFYRIISQDRRSNHLATMLYY